MKKIFGIVIGFTAFTLAFFTGFNTVKAATMVDFYTECNYNYTFNSKMATDSGITVIYSDMKDEEGNKFGIYASTSQSSPLTLIPFGYEGEQGTSTWFTFRLAGTSGNQALTTFETVYSQTSQCPKYLYADFVENKTYHNYYNIKFSDTVPTTCSKEDSTNCGILAELSSTGKKIQYDEDEDGWKKTYDGDNACSKLSVEISIKNNQFKATYENATGTTYSSTKVENQLVKSVDFIDIYYIANDKDLKIYVNPLVGTDQTNNGVSFVSVLGTKYCLIDGMPTLTKVCTTTDDISGVYNTRTATLNSEGALIATAASKYLNYDASTTKYSAKTYSDVTSVTELDLIMSDIQKITTSSVFSTDAKDFIDYFTKLSQDETLCASTKAQILSLLYNYGNIITQREEELVLLKETGANIIERFKDLGAGEQIVKYSSFLTNTQTQIDKLKLVSLSARQSYLEGMNFNITPVTTSGCGIISTDLKAFLQLIIDYIRIIGIILAVILGILDYIKVIFGSDEKSMSKANKNFMTRLIAVALLFLVPAILNFALGIFNVYGSSSGTCGIN